MKVLLVLGSAIPIPPPRWGGVENLIWQQKCALEKAGHEVTILNKSSRGIRKAWTAVCAKPWQYDVVHMHQDAHTKYWVPIAHRFRFKLVISTHYGYAAFPDKWIPKYHETFSQMCAADFMIVISQEIKKTFQELGCRCKIYVLPNGIDCINVRFAEQPKKEAIVLGRIEPRKKQAFLAEALSEHTVQCDFAGPQGLDPDFAANGRNTHYIGEWSREQVHNDLTEYACLVLLSDGEGHAAVVSEAMAAGLSLVLSAEASHNLDTSQPWITIVDRERDRERLGDIIAEAVRQNPQYRREIRRYCEINFDWDVILPRYIKYLEQIAGKSQAISVVHSSLNKTESVESIES